MDTFTVLEVYNGGWSIRDPSKPAEKPASLVNRCTRTTDAYLCEQILNGKAVAVVHFTATAKPGVFGVQSVRLDGKATPAVDLTIDGSHWTYFNRDAALSYRTENYFTGPDQIRFEQFESADGVSWKKTGQGAETRIPDLPAK